MRTYAHTKAFNSVFKAIRFIAVQNRTLSKCLAMIESRDELINSHMVKFYHQYNE